MIPPLVDLALDYYRNPLAYSHLADGSFPLPRGFAQQFSALCSALSPLHIDATAKSMDSSPEELEAAARFFARHVLLDPSTTCYRSLAVSPSASRPVIREHYLFLIKLFHPDRLPNATETDLACSRRLNTAYQVLSDPGRRTRYDREHLRGKQRLRHSDPREFFGPHRVPLQAADARPRPALAAKISIWGVVLGIGCVVLSVGAFALWELRPARPLRALAPLETTQEPPRPYYLRGAEAHVQTTAATTTSISEAQVATNALPAADVRTVTAEVPPDAIAIGTRIVTELQIALRRGDTRKLAELFTEPFPTDMYQGLGRSLPSEFSPSESPLNGTGSKLWLRLTDMVWQNGPDGWISGYGQALVAGGTNTSAGAQGQSGTIELELVPVDADYRIRRLRFRGD